MLAKVKADLRKHWVSWTGIIGLVIICPLILIYRPEQAVMVIMVWVLICFGMYLGATGALGKETELNDKSKK